MLFRSGTATGSCQGGGPQEAFASNPPRVRHDAGPAEAHHPGVHTSGAAPQMYASLPPGSRSYVPPVQQAHLGQVAGSQAQILGSQAQLLGNMLPHRPQAFAVAAATEAFATWKTADGSMRRNCLWKLAELLEKHREQLAELLRVGRRPDRVEDGRDVRLGGALDRKSVV